MLGGVTTLASLPIALVGGGGFTTQLGFSTMMYGGYMVASVFDSTIKSDMDSIGWNPFNSNESLVYNSSKVSFYKGMPAMWVNHSSARSASFLGIWLSGTVTTDDVKHEWGHGVQQAIMGWLKYLVMVGIPSAKQWGGNHWQGKSNYYRRPWEALADMIGGAAPRSGIYNPITTQDRKTAIWYTIVATLFGLLAFLFLI